MKSKFLLSFAAVFSILIAAGARTPAQALSNSGGVQNSAAPAADPGPVPLDWVPPALDLLGAHATKTSFTFDRSMIAAAAGLMGNMDEATKQAVDKLGGIGVHMLRFTPGEAADPAQVDAIRQAYHLRGWKHVITAGPSSGGPIQDGTTDVWIVLDGANIRGAVVLVDSPQTLTLATVSGNIGPEDLLHLRGHFGIPRFDADLSGESKK